MLCNLKNQAMRSVKKKVGPDWTTVVEDGVFHIGAHYKGSFLAKADLKYSKAVE